MRRVNHDTLNFEVMGPGEIVLAGLSGQRVEDCTTAEQAYAAGGDFQDALAAEARGRMEEALKKPCEIFEGLPCVGKNSRPGECQGINRWGFKSLPVKPVYPRELDNCPYPEKVEDWISLHGARRKEKAA